MIYQNESDFAAKLKNYEPHRVYFLYGAQNYLKKLYLKKLIAKSVDSAFADFNLNRFEGSKASLNEIAEAVEALPMMAARKCVVVSDLDCGKLSAAETNQLKELLADPPESTVLVFITSSVEVDAKKSAKWKAFIKLVDAVGDVVELGTRGAGDMNRFLKTVAEKNGCILSTDNCRYLTERCGDDMQSLKNEMDKLCAYRGEGEITRGDIDLCVTPLLDASVFDLAKLIMARNYQRAMQNLSELLYLREEPVAILSALSAGFIDLYRAKIARESGRTANDLSALFTQYKGKEWRVRNAVRDSDKFSKAQLVQILALLANADYRLKSSRADNVVILQETVTRIFAVK